MNFNSLSYLVFLSVNILVYYLLPGRFRNFLLLLSSYFFYMCWNPKYALLMLFSTGITYLCGLLVERSFWGKKKLWLAISFAANLLILFFFKYFNFLSSLISRSAALLGLSFSAPLLDVLLPVGISFYTFQALGYTVDVYRKDIAAEKNFIDYALFVSFFPQLVAGPIERAGDLLPQLRAARRLDRRDAEAGLRLLLCGFFRKVVIADFCGAFVTAAYSAPNPDGSAVFLATLLFAVQIYCDFAGYSEIAAGSARLLGVHLMRNFDRPYLARGFRDFWRRWHVSLGRWFTDYVYIPLGGSRKGLGRQLLAGLAVFALSGLWHGAEWSFVAWGLFHGALFASELLARRAGLGPARTRAGRGLSAVLTFAAVTFGWIFFRADSLGHAAALLGRLFSPWNLNAGLACLGLTLTHGLRLALLLALLPGLERLGWGGEENRPGHMTCVYAFLAVAVSWLIRLGSGGAGAFIYFQF